MPLSYEPLLAHVPAWLMVLFRLTGIFIFAPAFSSATVPGRVKVLLALLLSFCIYPVLLGPGGGEATASIQRIVDGGMSLWTIPAAVAMELMIGVIIGYGATLPLIGLQLSGKVVDQQLGLGLGGIYNPDLNEEAGVVGEFFFLVALAVFIILGGLGALLSTLIDTFRHVPLGGFRCDGQVILLVVGLLGSMFELAIRVAAPLLCVIFLMTVSLGFIARTVPQVNILSIGFPLRILLGMALLIGVVAVNTDILVDMMTAVMRNMRVLFGG